MISHRKQLLLWVLVCCLFSSQVLSEIDPYPVKASINSSVIGSGMGLETGLIGVHYSHWLTEPAVILNFGFGLEGYSPGVRIPLINAGNYDLFIGTAFLLTPGLLGMISGDDGGLIFSKDSFLWGGGLGLQRWVRKRTDYGFYLSVGMNYWAQLSGSHEGGGEVGFLPEAQIGVIF